MTTLAPCISVLGTASDVGKSIVVTALCRIFNDMGISVAPFKAQNMSNNSFVVDGPGDDVGEIGRAQVAQAEAARIAPHVDMNPVLLKPMTNVGSQVVVRGRAIGQSSAAEYGNRTKALRDISLECLTRLRQQYDLVVMEGAGSCAEVNLRARDFVNFEMAKQSDASVILVADIDRGGVFAQVLGTLDLLSDAERRLVTGVVINRFRGDATLFSDGIDFIEKKGRVKVLGMMPHIRNIGIDDEDAVVLDKGIQQLDDHSTERLTVGVIHLPHISNFTDFKPLERCGAVHLKYLEKGADAEGCDILMLPGTKSVPGDLRWLRRQGFDARILAHVKAGKPVLGICGGYQMLGRRISDPLGIEGTPGEIEGLGLLDVQTELAQTKALSRRCGIWLDANVQVTGYEIHQGRTMRLDGAQAVVRMTDNGELEGARSRDGLVIGTYLHGLLDSAAFLQMYLQKVNSRITVDKASFETDMQGEDAYDRLADIVRNHLDIPQILADAGMRMASPGKERFDVLRAERGL